MRKPQSLHSILEKTLKALEIDVPLKTYSILGAWNKIVGESVAEHSQPRSIRNRILFIDVSHSTWMQQLQFLKPTLLEKINTFLGESLIQDIRFKLGKISPTMPASTKTHSLEDEKLDKATLDRIENLLQEIDDDQIRKSLRDVLIKGAKLEQSRRKSK
jgi:predicted nucleic acid-binding Zn ribbon protein